MFFDPWIDNGEMTINVFGRIPPELIADIAAILVAWGWAEVDFVTMSGQTRVTLRE